MSWSPAFKALLNQPSRGWRVRVRSLTWYDSFQVGFRTLAWEYTNYRLGAGDEGYLIDLGTINGATIAPPDFRTSWGTFSFTVAQPLRTGSVISRGQLCVVEAGGVDWSPQDFEPVAIGQVWSIRGDAHSITVECRDVLASLTTRITQSNVDARLFSELGTTTLSSGYSPGDATMSLTSVTGFEFETGGTGLVQVEDNQGELSFVSFTGISGNDLTGLTHSLLDTTSANAGSGNTVRCVAYIPDHPIDVALKLLLSTGAGTNGPLDTLPDSWGYALPEAMVDTLVSQKHKFHSQPLTGSTSWEAYSLEPQEDGIAWIRDSLQLGGWVMVVRQGRIAIRAIPDHTGGPVGSPLGYQSTIELDNSDLLEGVLPEVEWYDQGYDREWRQVRLATVSTTGTRSEKLQTMPAGALVEIDISAYLHDNESAWITSLGRRLAPWYLRVPERITLEVTCGQAAQVAAGDTVRITTDRYAGRMWPLERHLALVLSSSFDLLRGTGTLVLSILPSDLDVNAAPLEEAPVAGEDDIG